MTVVARLFLSIPARTASETWEAIVKLLAPDTNSDGHKELLKVNGTASMLIADEAPKNAAIILSGSGPRVRIYCLYGDDAITGNGVSESPLSFCAAEGGWTLSIPCPTEDLAWVQEDLTKRTSRIVARDLHDLTKSADDEASEARDETAGLNINRKAFFRT